jgi:di/tricarboxylate transporter
MSLDAWIAVAVVVVVFGLLAWGRVPTYLVLLGGLVVVLATGIVSPEAALAGFGNPGLWTVALLFVVAAGLSHTGALGVLLLRLLGRPSTAGQAQRRLVGPVLVGSAVLNNTPLVAMLMPVVLEWCKAARIPPSKVLLPLSYTAILGGMLTLIGTSTNIVVNGLWMASGHEGMGLFEITKVGLPAALVGLVYMLLVGGRLLPSRGGGAAAPDDARNYSVEMVVAPAGPLVGKSIEEAGLRRLPGLFLMEIHRQDNILPAVDPQQHLAAGDQLVFVGMVDSVVDLQRMPGLVPATRQVFKLDAHRAERCFAEAVVSPTCPGVGMSIREGRFRTRYNAVVIAVSREGERVPGRIGDIELRAGDALLLEAPPNFVDQQRNSRDFYLVSRLDFAGPPTTAQAPIALAILGVMVVVAGLGLLTTLQAAALAATAILVFRCCSEETARRSVDWSLLLAIGSSFALGAALGKTGAAAAAAQALLRPAGDDPLVALALIYLGTTLITELVTNNAAAIIVFPIAMSAAEHLGVSPMPFVMSVMIGASAGFATPLGYQTHLMVYGPGGYRLSDFLKIGIPMNVVVGVVTVLLAPVIWPF